MGGGNGGFGGDGGEGYFRVRTITRVLYPMRVLRAEPRTLRLSRLASWCEQGERSAIAVAHGRLAVQAPKSTSPAVLMAVA